MDEQQIVARRLAGHFPVQRENDGRARLNRRRAERVAAQLDQSIELDVYRIGQRVPFGPFRRAGVGRGQVAEEGDEGQGQQAQVDDPGQNRGQGRALLPWNLEPGT